MRLELADGLFVDEVSFTISGNDLPPIEGAIPVEETGSTLSIQVSGIPTGVGYLVQLTAGSVDLSCVGQEAFDVSAGETTLVRATLDCSRQDDDGTVIVDGGFNVCPTITSLVAVPLSVAVSGQIQLAASATDANGDAIAFEWTASSGQFDLPNDSSTNYLCQEAGTQLILLNVSDGRCNDSAQVSVQCVELCGNADLDPGEECDDGARVDGDGCSADCLLEVCGNSRTDAGEECDDGNLIGGDGCDALCRVEVCGNSRTDAGEECDDGNLVDGDGCSQACLAEVCGNGRIDHGEECDDGNLEDRDGCDSQCRPEDLCELCLEDNCADRILECDTQACADVLVCVATSGCAAGGTVTDCYCGEGVDIFTCLNTTLPLGSCRSVVEQGTQAVFPSVVLERLLDAEYPAGGAMQLVLCEQQHCSSSCEL